MQENIRESPETVFARRVKELREARGWSQARLAEAITAMSLVLPPNTKLDPTAVTRLERGERSIRLDEAVKIARIFDLTVDEVLRPARSPEEQLAEAQRQVEAERWRWAEAAGQLQAAEARLSRLREGLSVEDDGGEQARGSDERGV